MGTFRWITAGESHGPGLTAVVEGIPAGLYITEEYIGIDMARRQKGYGRGGRMLIEKDWAIIRSGVRHGYTMGSPISLLVDNRDWANWTEPMSIAPIEKVIDPVTRLRPGHADIPGTMKFNQGDVRPILERSSAREFAARVAAGALARRFLEEFGVEIHSHVTCIGGVHAKASSPVDWNTAENYMTTHRACGGSGCDTCGGEGKVFAVRCADREASEKMVDAIEAARAAGDTVGGIVEVIATGVPMGLGTHIQWDRKLSTKIMAAIGSLNAVKGVEIGTGFEHGDMRGSITHDVVLPMSEWREEPSPFGPWKRPWQRRTNNAGGIEGGMTNGEPIVVKAVVKPIATMINPLPSVDLHTGEVVQAHYERSDITFVPTVGVVAESMLALILTEAALEKFGGDHMAETLRNLKGYLDTLGPRGV
ncbi:MAG: chorismate synthase [Dehalococcoidia bacterium]|nr:chorismate synthase [Dehalococcoidia bacterium]